MMRILHVKSTISCIAAVVLGLLPIRDSHSSILTDKLDASDKHSLARFGYSLDLSEDTLVVGSPGHTQRSGAAYVYSLQNGVWQESAILVQSDRGGADNFGNSVAVAGNRIVVGAWWEDDANFSDSGAAYVFDDSGGSWAEIAKLESSNPGQNHTFGGSVAIDGDVIAVGSSYGDSIFGNTTGEVEIFEWFDASWNSVARLGAADADPFDLFGVSVAVDGDIAVVGAPGNDTFGADAGSAYVFQRKATGWENVATLAAPDSSDGLNFGTKVAISGGNIAVSATEDDTQAEQAGAVYIFRNQPSGWDYFDKLVAPDGERYDRFGRDVDIFGDSVLIGADGAEGELGVGGESGVGYLFRLEDATGVFVDQYSAFDALGGDFLGFAVALNDTTLAFGAFGDDQPLLGTNLGAVYLQGVSQEPSVSEPPVYALFGVLVLLWFRGRAGGIIDPANRGSRN